MKDEQLNRMYHRHLHRQQVTVYLLLPSSQQPPLLS
jgi:hypothetical protein